MKKRRLIFTIVGLVVVAVLTGVYFFVIQPYYAQKTAKPQADAPELLQGEAYGPNNRILLFPQVERSAIAEIEVHNTCGSYLFTRDDSGAFYIQGKEGAPIDSVMTSSLVVSAGYAISIERLMITCENWHEYGLDETDNPAWYSLKTISGEEHTVQIGNMIPDGSGYYCRYAGRDALYTVDSSIASTLLSADVVLITPILGYPMSESDYFTVTDFILYRNNEKNEQKQEASSETAVNSSATESESPEGDDSASEIPSVENTANSYGDIAVWITYTEDQYQTDFAYSNLMYRMIAPADYIPSDENYESILKTLMDFRGSQTLAAGPIGSILDGETLSEYHLDNPAYVLHYTYQGIENYVMFSEKNADGTYYAYTTLFNLVAVIDGADFAFLDWPLIQFVDNHLFCMNIAEVTKIQIHGKTIEETFTLRTQGEDLIVTPQSTKKPFDAANLKNFRQLYKTLLTVYIDGYTTDYSTNEPLLEVTVTTIYGKIYEYRFYGTTTRRCYFTCNGDGEFYVLRDMVEKIESDAVKLMNGTPIDSWAKN